jgi:hypothetical protein
MDQPETKPLPPNPPNADALPSVACSRPKTHLRPKLDPVGGEHYEESSESCAGVMVWCKGGLGRRTEYRRECPICGRREVWDVTLWKMVKPNPTPGVNKDRWLL